MRLYLSSTGFGMYPQRLINLVTNTPLHENVTTMSGNIEVSVILNANDDVDRKTRMMFADHEMNQLRFLGFQPKELDLRDYFHREKPYKRLRRALATSKLVWVCGGTPSTLCLAMYASGFDHVIKSLLTRDAIVYGGYSAGCIVLSPAIEPLDLEDNPYKISYPSKSIPGDGLNIIPYTIVPHYSPYDQEIKAEIDYYVKNGIPFKTLSDGEVIIINGEREELISYNGTYI